MDSLSNANFGVSALPPAAPHRNRQLFSDYYLNELLPGRPEWNDLLTEATTARERLRALFAAYTPGGNEAQVEADWVRPVFATLGHTFEVQAPLDTPENVKRPDYVFYPNAAAVSAHRDVKKLNEAILRAANAYAVGDAKAWDRPLDITEKKTGKSSAVFDNKNPTYQIAFYIQHTGLAWGILTNGRLWRLYHRDTAHKLSRFYEVDLPALLDGDDPAPFLYFYAFFRRAAFDDRDRLTNSATLRASEDFARGIGDSLKRQVYDALRHIAQGFLDHPANGLSADDPTTRRALYDNALILLYRLLFVLYAEARELLPIRETDYRETYSLYALKRQIAKDRDNKRFFLPSSVMRWPTLRELFQIIDRGSPPLKVTTYNGGLFDAARHPFLEKFSVGDVRLNAAIECLTRVVDPVTGNRVFVDYRDLSERHLGTIYEGLLEFQIRPLAAPSADGFSIELVNDRGERRATGSYYTPDYVVKYIVDETVGPTLREAVAGKTTDAEIIAAVLSVNVLDPAMGSGHFLVEATEYIARFLVDLGVAPDTAEPDISYWKRRVVHSCIYGVDLNPLAVDLAKLSLWLATLATDRPLSFLDHHLRTGNALVGAAMADLSVNILRDKKKPKKTPVAKGASNPSQLSLLSDDAFKLSIGLAVNNMWLIEDSEADSVAAVKQQEELYVKIKEEYTRRYKNLADVVTAAYFGLPIERWLWTNVADFVTGRVDKPALPQIAETAARAGEMAREQRFFHWSLEFPELFFDKQGRPLDADGGFDVVIGNPPYIRQEALAAFKPYFQTEYADIYSGTADLFVYFFGQALRQLRRGGRTSFISSNSWLRANYATALRAHLRGNAVTETLVDLGDNRVFADAPDVYPAIHVVRKDTPEPDAVQIAQVATFNRGEGLANFDTRIAGKLAPVSIHDQSDSGWQLSSDANRDIFTKLRDNGTPLQSYLSQPIYFGIKTGLNECFILSESERTTIANAEPQSIEFMPPVVRGQELRPWYVDSNSEYVIVFPSGWTKNSFPTGLSEEEYWILLCKKLPVITTYLEHFKESAKQRSDMGNYWWELRACTYYDVIKGPKILWPDIAKEPRFVLDRSGLYGEATTFFTASDSYFLLAVLQARTSWYMISYLCHNLGERAGMIRYRLKTQYMVNIPIPNASPADQELLSDLARRATETARERYALHQKTRHRLQSDLLPSGKTLNNRLTEWWDLPDLKALRAELGKVAKTDIPVNDRDDWEELLQARKAAHKKHTDTLVALETEINAHVYRLFALSPDEQKQIEEATRYQYGEI